jgi:sugar phosphate isomerase/epimerase
MRLGLGTYACAWVIGVPGHLPARPMTAVGFLERAAELGLHLVQIADNMPLDRMPPEELQAVERKSRDLGIDIELGTRGIAHDHLRRYLGLASRFKSPILRTVVDTADHRPSASEVARTLSAIMPEFERTGVVLAIENHDRFCADTLAGIVEGVGSTHLGVCLDTANSFGALEGPRAVLQSLDRHVVNLHVKDFRIRRASHMMGFTIEGCPAGEGQLDIPWLLGMLSGLGRCPSAILELWPPPEASLEETINKEKVWAEKSIKFLSALIPL